MRWAKVRLGMLLLVVFLLSGRLLSIHWNQVIPWPIQCSQQPLPWLSDLTQLIQQLDYPGYQLSVRASSGEIVHCAAGWAAPGPTLTPLRTDHRLRYASLSKVFTSVVASQLIAEGLLDIDRSMVSYLVSEFDFADPRMREITLEQLLRHTAGFDRSVTPDPMMQALPWCPAQLEVLQDLVLDHDPGSYYAYSNLGYCLLGAVIEQVEKQSLADVFQRRIFLPAGVNDISMVEAGRYHRKEPRYSYDQPDTDVVLLEMPYSHMVATGAWVGASSDFLQVLEKTFDGSGQALLGSPSQAKLLVVEPDCDVSLWRICHGNGFYLYQPSDDTPELYWRDGSLPGVTSFAGLMDGGGMFVFLANGRRYSWLEANDKIGQFLYEKIRKKRAR